MDAIDFHYYKDQGGNRQPAYDFENLILTAGCDADEIHFSEDGREMTKEDFKRHGYFIHEFLHHVQNFSTNWGSTIFVDFVLAYLKIAGSYVDTHGMIEIPPRNGRIENKMLWEGYDEWVGVHDRIRKSFSEEREEKNKVKPIEFIEEPDETISFDNGRVKCKTGLLVVREHMADLGALLFCGYSDQQIQDHHRSFESFLYEGELSKKSHYWIVFEFFKENYSYKNLALGLFRLMNECLTRLNPDKAFFRFMKFWKTHADRRLFGKDFAKFVCEWRTLPLEVTSFNKSLNDVLKHMEKRLELFNRITENDLSGAAKGILEHIYQNINLTAGGRNLFKGDQLNNVKNWYEFVSHYGTPIVAFTDATKVLGTKEYCNTMLDNFMRINSVSMVMKKLHEDRVFQCPFLWDIPICKAEFKGGKNCESHPFLETARDENNGSCNFRNGVLLLKLENRMSFS